jgi:hypothetical protein
VPIRETVKAILHFVPDGALSRENELDLAGVQLLELCPLPSAPLGYSDGIGLEAIYCYNEWAYTALFRNGIVEAVEGLITREKIMFPTELELEIVKGAQTYLGLLRRLGVEPPVRVFLTLIGVAEHSFPMWNVGALLRGIPRIREDIIDLRGPALDSLEIAVPLAFRQLFDRLWNALGYARCLDYDENGAWRPRRRNIVA